MIIKNLKERLMGDYVIDPRHDIVIYDILVRDGFIPFTLFLGLIASLLFITVRTVYGFYLFDIFHIIYLAFLVLLFYLYKFFPKQGLFRFLIFIIFIFSLWPGVALLQNNLNEYLIILIFPVITYNLSGIKTGTIWNAVLGLSFLAVIMIIQAGHIQSGYQVPNLIVVFILYVFISIFSYYAEIRHSTIEKLILRQLYYDNTSGLPNRKMLIEDIALCMYPSLIILRIDNFHDINTFFGYSLGDNFLKFIGKRINLFSSSSKTKSYNLSGGEFAFVLDMKHTGAAAINELKKIAAELIEHITEEKYIHQDTHIPLTPYIGIAPYFDGSDGLISQADIALHHAIDCKHSFHIYSDDDKDLIRYIDNVNTLSDLNNALINDRITPYFQAIIDNRTGKIDKYESLLRIIDSNGVPQLPGKYLEVARKTNLYHELTKIMIDKVFNYMENNSISFSINISADDIYNPDFLQYLNGMIKKHPSCSGRITLELVESERFNNYGYVVDFIKKCKQWGYSFAIDDFGTGYSNFSHLTKLNVDFIKFDGSLIRNIDSDPTTRIIVKNITALCKELNIKTIAEFVENEVILNAVNEYGIDYSQGCYINSPSPSAIPDK
jgi:EAL domain-containing protein (putative c-di-GMP-specific phosphodiesterase class I)/GGDEF domain-containing protein